LWTQDGEVVLDVITDPKRTMDNDTEEHATTRPTMDVVELLVAISRSQKERNWRNLRREEENDWELGEC
jgi:hypothetical protein